MLINGLASSFPNSTALRQYSLIGNTVTRNGQAANSLDINDLIHAVLLESRWRGNVVGSSDINKCRRARCRKEFALRALAVGRSINVAPDPGLAGLNRACEYILSSSGDGLGEDMLLASFSRQEMNILSA